MIRPDQYASTLLWAAREIQRRGGRSILLFACLASLVFLCATSLLFSRAMETTWFRLMDAAPDLVVRRIDAGGWAALPADEAVLAATAVPGVIDPTPRIWGVVSGPAGPLTVVATPQMMPAGLMRDMTPPSIGQAVVGQGVARSGSAPAAGRRLTLSGTRNVTVDVVASFPADSDPATHDVVWMAPVDARRLLGLAPHQASDLAIRLFHREEEQAIQPDLAAAFPWPVHITDRSTSTLGHHQRAIRTGGITLTAAIPALLALLLIIVDTGAGSTGRPMQWGLLKSMGWSTKDILRLQIAQAVIVGVPAAMAGFACAYPMVFYPPFAGATAYWITGGTHLTALVLDPTGAFQVMLEVAAMVLLPYLATVFITTLHRAGGDPWTMLQANPWH